MQVTINGPELSSLLLRCYAQEKAQEALLSFCCYEERNALHTKYKAFCRYVACTLFYTSLNGGLWVNSFRLGRLTEKFKMAHKVCNAVFMDWYEENANSRAIDDRSKASLLSWNVWNDATVALAQNCYMTQFEFRRQRVITSPSTEQFLMALYASLFWEWAGQAESSLSKEVNANMFKAISLTEFSRSVRAMRGIIVAKELATHLWPHGYSWGFNKQVCELVNFMYPQLLTPVYSDVAQLIEGMDKCLNAVSARTTKDGEGPDIDPVLHIQDMVDTLRGRFSDALLKLLPDPTLCLALRETIEKKQ